MPILKQLSDAPAARHFVNLDVAALDPHMVFQLADRGIERVPYGNKNVFMLVMTIDHDFLSRRCEINPYLVETALGFVLALRLDRHLAMHDLAGEMIEFFAPLTDLGLDRIGRRDIAKINMQWNFHDELFQFSGGSE